MTREQAIEIIQELWRYKETDKYTEAEIRQALAMATKALGQEPRWISVSERLPKNR